MRHKHKWKEITILGVELAYCSECETLRDKKGKETGQILLHPPEKRCRKSKKPCLRNTLPIKQAGGSGKNRKK